MNTKKYDFYPTEMIKGTRNMTVCPEFIKYCRIGARKLKKKLAKQLRDYYDEVIVEDGFIYCRSVNAPCLLTAHMDTVHENVMQNYYEWTNEKGQHIVASPDGIGGDDRCGVYMIMKILKETDLRPAILFCEDEEIGGIGSAKFVMTDYIGGLKGMKYLIELDRCNGDDLVFYDDANNDFHYFCESVTGYRESWGSFSDISNLAPACGVSAVNISCGYYDQHTKKETVNIEEMQHSIKMTKLLIEESQNETTPFFEYEEDRYAKYYGKYGSYYDYYGDFNSYKPAITTSHVIEFTFVKDGAEVIQDVKADDEYEAVAKLMIDNPTICYNDIVDYYWVQ